MASPDVMVKTALRVIQRNPPKDLVIDSEGVANILNQILHGERKVEGGIQKWIEDYGLEIQVDDALIQE